MSYGLPSSERAKLLRRSPRLRSPPPSLPTLRAAFSVALTRRAGQARARAGLSALFDPVCPPGKPSAGGSGRSLGGRVRAALGLETGGTARLKLTLHPLSDGAARAGAVRAAAHQSEGGTYRIVPVENGRWVVGDTKLRLLTTAGRMIKPDHCPSCGSPDRLGGLYSNCEAWEWLWPTRRPVIRSGAGGGDGGGCFLGVCH